MVTPARVSDARGGDRGASVAREGSGECSRLGVALSLIAPSSSTDAAAVRSGEEFADLLRGVVNLFEGGLGAHGQRERFPTDGFGFG